MPVGSTKECELSLRLKVLSINQSKSNGLELICSKEINSQTPASLEDVQIYLEGVWSQNILHKNDNIHILNPSFDESSNHFIVDNYNGLLVIEPDNLYTCTLIASSLFCERKTWLNNVFLGPVGSNKAMTIGTLTHEIFQHALKTRTVDIPKLTKFLDDMLDDATIMLQIYSAETTMKEVRDEVIKYIPNVREWIEKYMFTGPPSALVNDSNLEVKLTKVHDIEENVWSTKYGLKGKIDVTGLVKVHDKKSNTTEEKIIPLELKTGNPNLSSSHAAQVSLYSMMIEDRYAKTNQGFVIYLKEKAAMHNVSLTKHTKRDLIQRRNSINHYMKDYSHGPDMLNQLRVCSNCERVQECILTSKIYSPAMLDENPVMKSLEDEATGHLDPKFIDFFKHHHERLVNLMTKGKEANGGSFWNTSSQELEEAGTGFGKLQASGNDDNKFIVFKRHPGYEKNFIDEPVDTQPRTKRLKIEDYFKPTTTSKRKPKPFDVEITSTRCRFAISIDNDEQDMDSQNATTAIAIGFINDIKEDQFTMKIYEGNIDVKRTDVMYRVDKIQKRVNFDLDRIVLIKLLEKSDTCDRIRKFLTDPEYKPKENLDLNMHLLLNCHQEIDTYDAIEQKFIVGAISTENYYVLNEKIEPNANKINRLLGECIGIIRKSLDKTLVIVGTNIDSMLELMRILRKRKISFNLVDDGSSQKARYEFSAELIKVCQLTSIPLEKKFDMYVKAHETAKIIFTTYSMSIGGLQFSRRRFDYCIALDCQKIELFLGLGPMFMSDRHILIDVRRAAGDDVDSQTEPIMGNNSLGKHIRSIL